MHFDAFDAFSTDALVHFGSGIQVQGGGSLGSRLSAFASGAWALRTVLTELQQFHGRKTL